MRSEVGVQLGLIEAKRGGLPAGHGLLDGFDFLFHARGGLRAGGDHWGWRGVKNHQQSDGCGNVGCPAHDLKIRRSGLALRGAKSSERLPLLIVAGAFMVRLASSPSTNPKR